jgi:hypothetical protein
MKRCTVTEGSFMYIQTQQCEGEWSVYDLERAPSIHCLDLKKQQEWKEKTKRKEGGGGAFPYHDV